MTADRSFVTRSKNKYERAFAEQGKAINDKVAGGVEVRVKTSQDLMHFKSYVIDGTLLRTGSANWSPTGLMRQDNDLHYEIDTTLAALFESRFEVMSDRATNRMETTPSREGAGCSRLGFLNFSTWTTDAIRAHLERGVEGRSLEQRAERLNAIDSATQCSECCHLRRSPRGVQSLIHAGGVRCRGSVRTMSGSSSGE